METRSMALRVAVCIVALLVWGGCAPDYPDLQPGEMRAFKIPVNATGIAADSTLCLFSVPVGYTPDHPFPLVVALHGGGSSAALFHDLWQPVTQSRGFVLATPQGEQRGSGGIGYHWGPNADDTVRRCVDVVLSKVNIKRSEIFLTGFSQGGHLTYALARSYPHVFAGIAPIGAGYDLPNASTGSASRDMRIYIGHGEKEAGLEEILSLAARLRDQGCSVRLAIYPDTGHGIPQPISSELRRILEYFEEAPAVQQGALTALFFLRKGNIRSRQKKGQVVLTVKHDNSCYNSFKEEWLLRPGPHTARKPQRPGGG